MNRHFLYYLFVGVLIAGNSMIYSMDQSAHITTLNDAIVKKDNQQVARLLATGINLKSLPKNVTSPLFLAITQNSPEIVELLIKAGIDVRADLDRVSPEEYEKRSDIQMYASPLHYAVSEGYVDIARALIEAGADIHAPMNLVSKGEYQDVSEKIGQNSLDIAKNFASSPASSQLLLRHNEDERVAHLREIAKKNLLGMDLLRVLLTTVSPQEIQHIIPAVISLTMRQTLLGKDVGRLIVAQLVPQIVRAKLTLAKQYPVAESEDQLRVDIITSINRVIKKSPRIKAAINNLQACSAAKSETN
ncbi:MAG: ankyrin repeat domain-containing protein [Candidatus Babeliales bacterium]